MFLGIVAQAHRAHPGVIQMSDKRESWIAEPPRTISQEKSKETKSVTKGNSMWIHAFGFNIEEPRGKRPKNLTLQEHINIFDYRRYFYKQTGTSA
jgi:hypothetical protein